MTNLPLCKHRYALLVSYLGTKYNGSQRLILRDQQGNQDTIQEALECSLESILPKSRCRVTSASRTDKGVHALMNCYSLPLQDYKIPTVKIRKICNTNLFKKNHEIVVKDVILVPPEFHPRKLATSREYIYRIAVPNKFRADNFNKTVIAAELHHTLPVHELYRVLPLPCLNVKKVEEAINVLKGEHDFASFVTKLNENECAIRNLEIDLIQADPVKLDKYNNFTYYHLHFKSSSFLHNQIRRLVGAIISYACFDQSKLDDIKWLIDNPASCNWRGPMKLAEPFGLYLSKINYDKSSFEGAIETHEDLSEEKVDGFRHFSDDFMSDDNTNIDNDDADDVRDEHESSKFIN